MFLSYYSNVIWKYHNSGSGTVLSPCPAPRLKFIRRIHPLIFVINAAIALFTPTLEAGITEIGADYGQSVAIITSLALMTA